jgi:hypothetical protein
MRVTGKAQVLSTMHVRPNYAILGLLPCAATQPYTCTVEPANSDP